LDWDVSAFGSGGLVDPITPLQTPRVLTSQICLVKANRYEYTSDGPRNVLVPRAMLF